MQTARSAASHWACLDASPDPTLVVRSDSAVQFANSAARELLGYRPGELEGVLVKDLLDPEFAFRIERLVPRLLWGPARTLRMEHRMRRKDGRWVVVAVTVGRHVPPGGEPVFVVTHRDITPRTRLDSTYFQVRREMSALFDLVPVGLALNDENRRIIAVNSALSRMLGRPAATLVGRRFEEFTHPDDIAESATLLKSLRRRKISSFQIRKRYIHSDGRILWANVHATAIPNARNGAKYYFGIVEDITDFKTKEAELRQEMAEQRRALIRETHHRIKNNLQGVVGLLIEQAELAPASADAIRAAIHRVQAIALVHGFFAAPGPGAHNICDVIAGIGRAMQDQYARQIRVSVCGGNGPVRMDPEEMVPFALILLEFVSNAVKHAPRGAQPIDITVIRGHGEATVEVVNTRGGLPAGFDLPRGLGIGTGLSLVKALVPPKGMELCVQPIPGGGVVARIRVHAPLVLPE